jgi:hypothetical protein
VIVTAQISGESFEHILAIERNGSNSFTTSFWPVPEGSTTYTIRAWALNKHGKRTAAPASQNVVVAPAGTGDLRLHRARGSTVGPGLNLTAGVDVRLNPGQGLEFSGSQVRADLGSGLAFSGNDLAIGVLAVVNSMLASGAVTGPKILANSVGAAHAIFQTAAIVNANIADLQVNKLTTGNLTVQMSIVSGGSIVAASGSNVAQMVPGFSEVRSAAARCLVGPGFLTVEPLSGSQEVTIGTASVDVVNSSGIIQCELSTFVGGLAVRTSGGADRILATATALALTSVPLTIGGTTAIDASRNAFLQQVTLNQRVTFGEAAANSTAPSWVHRIPVNSLGGGFIGYLKVSNA